jgi:hypothetical protein
MSAVRIRRQKSLSQARMRAEVVAHSGEDDVGGIAGAAFEEAAAEMTFGLNALRLRGRKE